MQNLTVIILTFNSEASLAQVVKSCQALASRILVVDSFSTDTTPNLAADLGCEVVQHPFENYSIQRNWAQTYACLGEQDWVLHLDSDEVLSDALAQSIDQLTTSPEVNGYLMRRLSYFLGKPIRFGQINPSWHLRLFRATQGFCEDRLYDQHFVASGKINKLDGLLLDLQLTTLEKWTAAHNRWSTAEALEVCSRSISSERQLPASLFGDLRMQKRWLKNKFWYRSPLLLRAFVYFFYSYFFRLGFLDGKVGLIYHVLQSFWFRYLVDAKIIELQMQKQVYSD
jgi:glycosyltransferase involved in cell wall biosynthesis